MNTHKLHVNNEICAVWIHQIKNGQKYLALPNEYYFCCNHFIDGMSAKFNIARTLFLAQIQAYLQNYAGATTSNIRINIMEKINLKIKN